MACFGFKTNDSEIVDKFVLDTDARLNSENFIKNPFKGNIKKIDSLGGESYFGVSMKPMYPHFYWAGLMLVGIQLWWLNFTFTWWMLPGALIFSLGIFYSSEFFYFILKKGLKKVGYSEKIKRISQSEIITIILSSKMYTNTTNIDETKQIV
jgi:hypothetical protein